MNKNANIFLVHGAWADGTCWSKVLLLLKAKGFNATAAQIPLTSLADDIAVTQRLLSARKGRPFSSVTPMAAPWSLGRRLDCRR
jgi:hypothetical protein